MCITDLRGLYEALVDKDTSEIELRKDFIETNFTYSALCDFVEQSAAIAPNVRIWASGVLYDNTLTAVQEIASFKTPAEFVYAIEHSPSKIMNTLRLLCKNYIEAHDEAAAANNKIATMLVQIDDLHRQLKEAHSDYESLQTVTNDTNAKLNALVSRVNFKYDKAVKPDEMFLLHENKYNRVLYIKEITRVHYVDTLIYYIEQILKTMYSVPVRSVVIEPYYSYGCEKRYPMYTPHWSLTYKDVYSEDIIMAGFQPKLMRDILQDSNHVHYLIILDRGGYRVPHVTGGNVNTVFTVSDLSDAPDRYNPKQLISYSDATLNIPFVEGFNELSPEEKIKIYSSMDVTKTLINILEGVK
ncbi:MAG: hypothetical protein NC548_10910 [Lachnospiraceae bacterium]|nr:hypothetical protein [Lachnospiraceae bacterium]